MPEGNVAPAMTREDRPAPPVARDESHSMAPPATPPPSERIVMVETRTEPPSGEQKP
jgi:hypothetical protein